MNLLSRVSNIKLRDKELEGLEYFNLAQSWVQWLSTNNMVTRRFWRAVTTVWWQSVLRLSALSIIWYTKLSDNGQPW